VHVQDLALCHTWTWKLLTDGEDHPIPQVTTGFKEEITVQLPQNATPHDFLSLYLSDNIVDLIVCETNRYADQHIQRNVIPPHSPVRTWIPTTRDEMFSFLGLALLMGLIYKPRLHMYWSGDEILRTPVFGQVMSRDRFLLILRFLHFNDNDLYDAKDP